MQYSVFVLSPAEGSSEEGRSCNVTSSLQINEKKNLFYKLKFCQPLNEQFRVYLVHMFNLHGSILASTGKYLRVDLEYHGSMI